MSVFKRWNGTQWETIGPGISSARFENINNMIAPEFDPKNTYDIGDYVVQSDKLYRCIYRIGTPQAWNSENWREVKLGQDVTELRNDVVTVSNTQPTSENNRIWVKPDDNNMKIPLVEDVMMLPNPNDYGENDQIPRSTGTGIEWVDYGLPSDQQTEDAINAWLNAHPEATTTVQDNSLTEEKFTNDLKLKTFKDYVTPEMFGAVGDGIADDTEAIQDMFDYMIINNVSVVANKNYLIKDTIMIDVPSNMNNNNINIDGILITDFSNNPGIIINNCSGWKININIRPKNNTNYFGGYDFGDIDDYHYGALPNVGVVLRNTSRCEFSGYIINFNVGLRLEGLNGGNVYNFIHGVSVWNCVYGIELYANTGGWVNNNRFDANTVSVWSDLAAINKSVPIHIFSSYKYPNNCNLFEGDYMTVYPNPCILVENGMYNRFFFRNEGGLGALFDPSAQFNEFKTNYVHMFYRSYSNNNIITEMTNELRANMQLVFTINNDINDNIYYKGPGSYYGARSNLCEYGTMFQNNFVKEYFYTLNPQRSDKIIAGIGPLIRLTDNKTIGVFVKGEQNTDIRCRYYLFDKNKQLLPDQASHYKGTGLGVPLAYYSSPSCLQSTGDINNHFKVYYFSDEVAYIFITCSAPVIEFDVYASLVGNQIPQLSMLNDYKYPYLPIRNTSIITSKPHIGKRLYSTIDGAEYICTGFSDDIETWTKITH